MILKTVGSAVGCGWLKTGVPSTLVTTAGPPLGLDVVRRDGEVARLGLEPVRAGLEAPPPGLRPLAVLPPLLDRLAI